MVWLGFISFERFVFIVAMLVVLYLSVLFVLELFNIGKRLRHVWKEIRLWIVFCLLVICCWIVFVGVLISGVHLITFFYTVW